MNLSILYKKLTNRKYTIGYKFILSLFVGFIGIISFCNANIVHVNDYNSQYRQIPGSATDNTFNVSVMGNAYFCFRPQRDGLTCTINGYNISFGGGTADYCFFNDANENWITLNLTCNNTDTRTNNLYRHSIPNIISGGSCPECPTCNPQYTSEQCKSVYGLVSSGQLNTCENNYNNCQSSLNSCQNNTSGFNDLLNNCSNNLNACNNSLTSCLQQNCPETITGTNRSSLFINNIQYPGAPTIKFTIPEEIERDQNTDEEETNIDVIGYGYDQDKMQQMVNTQYYKPTAEEMSGLMEKVADFLPLVAVALLIARIRRVVKKVF